jgi:hypothetical protein
VEVGAERIVLETLEEAGDPDSLPVQLAYLAAARVAIDDAELAAARRRALLVHAAGGDPHRDLAPDASAVTTLAADLATEERRAALRTALHGLHDGARGLPVVSAALDLLVHDLDDAWRWLACALLADELA